MINKILHSYTNGNTKVTIYEDGTKVREFENIPEINHPESIDVKITNYCDMGCEFCHESSTKRGKHADLEKLQNILYDLPAGIELACLTGDTVVYGKNGSTDIKNLKIGDFIYDSNNNLVEVVNIQSSLQSVHEIKGNKGFKANCTDDHPFISNGEEVEAKNLIGEKIDLLEPYTNFEEKENIKIDLAKYVTVANPNKRGSRGGIIKENEVKLNSSASYIPRFINVDKDLMWMYGLTVAEGSKKGLSLHIDEENYYLKSAKIYKNITTLGYKLYSKPEKNSVTIEFNESKAFQSIFFEEMEIGYGARNKSLSFLFKINNKELIRSAMEGLFDGDGCYRTRLINNKFKSFNLSYKTSSKKLAYDMVYLLKKHFDVTATLHHGWNKERKIEGRTLKPSDYYKIDIYSKKDIIKLFPDVFKEDVDFYLDSPYSTKGGTKEDCVVESFVNLNKEELVYDITLSEFSTHIFPINGYFLTHNCGGGNPLAHPDLIEFLIWCQMMGFIANMTVNQAHLKKFMPTIETLLEEKLIMGLGISINGNDWASVKYLKTLSDNIVYHVIAGVHKINILSKLEELGNCKVLILGYKTFGRGLFYFYENTGVLNIMRKWREYIRQYLGSFVISFDNLALEQLNIKSLMTPKFWETFYMGDDFTFTMYIDAVNEEYAPTSRSADNRIKFNDMSLFNYFGKFKGSFKE